MTRARNRGAPPMGKGFVIALAMALLVSSLIVMRAEAADPPNAWVEGRIQIYSNYTNISNATVIIQDTIDGSTQNGTMTNATGWYRLGIYTPAPRDFRITVFHPDYFYNGTTVSLNVGSNLTEVNMTLQPTGGANANVWGYVYDAVSMIPMMGISVLGISSDYINSAQTDITGWYTMSLVANREYTIHTADYVLPNLTYEGQNKLKRFNAFESVRMDFRLEPMNATLTGAVKDEIGNPINTAEVHVYRYVERPASGRTISYTRAVNGTGEYSFNLTRGIWQVEAYDTLGNHMRNTLTVTTDCNRTTTQDFRLDSLPTMATVFGNINWYGNGSAAEGVQVNAGLTNSTWNGGASTDAAGFYTLQVVPGTLRMEATYPGYVSNFETFDIGAGETLCYGFVLIPYEETAWLEGFVNSSGVPVDDAVVSAHYGRYTWSDRTDATGYYNFSLPAATLDLHVTKAGYDTVDSFVATWPGLATRQDFDITAVQWSEEIRGFVTDDLGDPVEGATIWMDGSGGWSAAVASDASGLFQRSVAEGPITYVIYATNHEYVTGTIDIVPGEIYWLNATLNRVTASGRIVGHVDNIYTDEPLAHVGVSLNMRDMNLWKTVETDAYGNFDVRIPPGVVTITLDAWDNGFVDPGPMYFAVKPTPDRWLNLSLFPRDATAQVYGTIYNITSPFTVIGANVTLAKNEMTGLDVSDTGGNYSFNTTGGSFDLSARAPMFRINRTLTKQFVAEFENKVLDINLALAPAWFSGSTSDNVTNLENDTSYEALNVFVGVDVAVSDTYRIVGELSEGRSLDSGITRSEQTIALGTGSHNITLSFSGATLWFSRLDGYYVKLTLTTAGNTTDVLDAAGHFTARRSWQDFELPGARITGPSGHWAVDTDFDGLYNLLVVNATLLVTSPGNYTVSSGLMDVAGAQVDQTLGWDYYAVGSYDVQAAFEGTAIYAHGIDLGSCQMYLINGLPADGNAPVQSFTTYTPYEFDIFQHYPIGATVRGRALNATNVPIQGLDVKLYNTTNRFMNSTKTDSGGNYTLGGWAGDWLIAFDDFDAKLSVYNGELANLSLAVGETRFLNLSLNGTQMDRTEMSISFPVPSDWNRTAVESLLYADADNRTLRFTFDVLYWWAGNGDGYLSQDEVEKIAAVLPWPNLPANSSELFTIDGFHYDLDESNVTRSLVAAGPVLSQDPVIVNIMGNYTCNGTIPIVPDHGMLLNATFDDTPSRMDSNSNNVSYVYSIQSPNYWECTANSSSANITITGDNTDLATVDPLEDPDPYDANTSEWVVLNFTQRVLASDYGALNGLVTLQGSADYGGVTVTAYDNASGLPVASATTNADGYYIINALASGGYNVSAAKAGYVTGIAVNLSVTAGASTQQDFSLVAIPPTISHEGVKSALVDRSYAIYAEVHDESGVDTVLLNYTGVNATPYSIPMARIADTPVYFAEVPAQAAPGIVTYLIWASNVLGASARDPPSSVFVTEIYETHAEAISPYWQTTSPLGLFDSLSFLSLDANTVTLWYRYSADNATWGTWTVGPADAYPWDGVDWSFAYPDGEGFYEFYSIAADNKSCIEEAPPIADARCIYDSTMPSSYVYPITPYWRNTTTVWLDINISDAGLVGPLSVVLNYRYSANNVTWGGWGPVAVFPWSAVGPMPSPIIYQFTFSDGTGFYEFCSIAYDKGGNPEPKALAAEAACGFDNILPTTVLNPVVSYWQTAFTISLPGYGFDNGSSGFLRSYLYYRFSPDNITWNPAWSGAGYNMSSAPWGFFNGTFNFVFGPGYYQFDTIGLDNASNWEKPVASLTGDITLCYDNATPISSANATGAYWQTSSPFTVTANANDAMSGVTAVELWFRFSPDNITWEGWTPFGIDTTGPWSWQFAAQNGSGFYEFYTLSSDAAGNIESAPASADARCAFDPNPPAIISFDAGPAPCELGQSLTFVALIGDISGIANVTVNISEGVNWEGNFTMSYVAYQYSLTFTPSTVGDVSARIWVLDNQGMVNTTSLTVPVRDTTSPSITGLTANPSPQEVLGSVNVSATISDISGVATYRINITAPGGVWLLNDTMKKGPGQDRYYYNFTLDVLGGYSFVIWAVDAIGNGNSTFGAAVSQDTQLPYADAGMAQTVESGMTATFDASSSTDNYGIENWTWSFNDNGIRRLYGQYANYTFSANGTFEITLAIRDFGGNTATARTWVNVSLSTNTGIVTGTVLDANGNAVVGATVYIDGTSPTVETTTDPFGRFTLTGVPTGTRTIVVIASGYKRFTQEVQVVRAQTASMGSLTLENDAVTPGPQFDWLWMAAIAAIAAAVVIVAVFLLAARKRRAKSAKTVIDEIFLMYNDGRLIKHFTRRLRPDMDSDILSSMLVAVQDFIKDSFKGEEGMLDEMKFGRFQILLGRGKHIIVCAIVLGEELDVLRPQVQKCVKDIEEKYKDALEAWDGEMGKLTGTFKYVMDLIDGRYA